MSDPCHYYLGSWMFGTLGRTGPDVNFTFLGSFYVLYKKHLGWLLSQPVVSHADRRGSDVCKLYGMCDALQVLTLLLVVSYCNDTQLVTPIY